jgi:hypothetical protein
MIDNTEFYKESLKLEIEKMKIYAAFFAGLVNLNKPCIGEQFCKNKQVS